MQIVHLLTRKLRIIGVAAPVIAAFLSICPSAWGLGITSTRTCYTQPAFFPVTITPQPSGTDCGVVYYYTDGGYVTADGFGTATYSLDDVLTQSLTGNWAITRLGAAYVFQTITSTFTDSLELIGPQGASAYLTALTFNSLPTTTIQGGPPTSQSAYGQISGLVLSGSSYVYNLVVPYNQPIPITTQIMSNLTTGYQGGPVNSGSETLKVDGNIEFVITAQPWQYGQDIVHELPAPYTLDSQLGITYDQVQISLAPEPDTALLDALAMCGLGIAGWRRHARTPTPDALASATALRSVDPCAS